MRPISVLACVFTLSALAQISPNPRPAQTAPATSTPANKEPPGTSVVKVTCNAPCKFFLDGELKDVLSEDDVLRISVRPGKYQFKAVSTVNALDELRMVYTLTASGTEEIQDMELRSVIDARERTEQAALAAKAQTEWQQAQQEQSQREEALRLQTVKEDLEKEKESALLGLEQDMVLISGGSFTMGCISDRDGQCNTNELPPHRVNISSFFLGKYEVTQALWERVMGNNPSGGMRCGQCPVENVGWANIQDFIAKLNTLSGKSYRLPTESEWEFAARGGSQSQNTKYSGSDHIDGIAWCRVGSTEGLQAVGQKAPNELGLHDMSGNVWELCSDWVASQPGGRYNDYYKKSPERDPPGPDHGVFRVLRGGSADSPAERCRLASGAASLPDGEYFYYEGFRLARNVPTTTIATPGKEW